MQEEIWKDVVGLEGIYQVSSEGRIKSVSRNVQYYNPLADRECVRHLREKIMKPQLSKRGYYLVCSPVPSDNGVRTSLSIHRIVAKAFLDNPDNKPTVNHKNGNKLDNRLQNLEWATFSENLQHAYDTGLAKSVISKFTRRGEDHHKVKLSNSDIVEIKKLRAKGLKLKEIASLYSVSFSLISQICLGDIWKHL